MGAKCKIKCSPIGIIFVLIGCGTTLSFECGSNGQNPPFKGNLMDFFSKMFQKHSQNGRLPWPKMIQSVNQVQDISHWGPYQRPVQQSDYERNFYNFGVQKDPVYSDEGTDYSSLDFSCQEPSIQHNDPCGEAESEYTAEQTVDCNDNKYGIRWKGLPPEQANVEIEEVVSKGGQAQWSKGGGESGGTNYDEIAPRGTPNFNGLTKIDIHNCYPQEPQRRGHEANGSQAKTTGNEYFVLVIKKDHLLGNARTLNTTATSIDAIIGASLQPTNRSNNATAHDNSQSFNESSSQSPPVDRAYPMMTAADSQPAINPTRDPVSSAENPTSTTTTTPDDESVSQSTDVPTKITILENPKISSSNTKPVVNAQPKFHPTQIPLNSTQTPGTISKIRPDEVVSQPIDGATKISLTHKPAIQNSNTPESNSLSKKFNPYANSPITTVIPTNYLKSSETTAIPAREDSQSTVPQSSTPVNNASPIVNHTTTFAPTTVEAYDSQSADQTDNSNTAQVTMMHPENTPKSPELSSGPTPNGKNPELIVNYTNFTEAPITMDFPVDSNSKPKEYSWRSNINYDSVTPRLGDYGVKITTTIVNILSPVVGSSNPTFLGSKPTVGKARPTEEDTTTVYGARIDLPLRTATIVNDMSDDETRPHPTSFVSTSLNDSNSVVDNAEPPGQDSTPVSTPKSDLQPKTATIVNEMTPIVTSPKSISFSSSELSDSMPTTTKPTEERTTTSSKPTYFSSRDLSDPESTVDKTKPTEEDAIPFVAAKADPQLRTTVNDMPPASKPQPKSLGSTHLSDSTTIVEKTTLTPIFLMENNSQSALLGSGSTDDQLPGVNKAKSSPEDAKSRILNDHRLLIADEKIPIQSNGNIQNALNSQSTEITLNNNFVPEKETFPPNNGKPYEEVSLPNPTNLETFTIASNSNSSNETESLMKGNTDKTKLTSPQTAKDGKNYLKTTPTVIGPEFAVTTSKELPKTLKTTLVAKNNSQSTVLNSSLIQFTSDTRSNGSNAGVDFVAAVSDSQSQDSTSNSNSLANDGTTLVNLIAGPHPQFRDSEISTSTENYKIGTTSHEDTSDAAAVIPTDSQVGHTSGHNMQDIAHRIKGLQDLVYKLMSTVSSPVTSNVALSPKSIQNPINIQNTTVSNLDSVKLPQGTETTPTVDESKGTGNVTLPKAVSISDGLQSDFDSTPIVSAKNPRLKDNEPTIETTPYSIVTTPYSIVTAANSESETSNSNPKSMKDNGRSSVNESVTSTTPTVVLSSQSSRPDPKPLMNFTATGNDDQSAVKKDSPSIAKPTELPPQSDPTVNGSTISLKDPPTVDEDTLLGVSRSDNRKPSSLESSTSHSFNKPATVNDNVASDDGSIVSRNPLAMNLNNNAANGVKYEMPTTTEANSSRSAEVAKSENKATDNGRSLNGAPPPKDLSNNALQSTNGPRNDVAIIGGRASSRSPDVTLDEMKASDNGRSLIESPQPKEGAKGDMSTIDGRADSRSPDATLNKKKASDNGRSLIESPSPTNLSNNALHSANGSRNEMPTIGGRVSSRSPDANLNEKMASDNERFSSGTPPPNDLSSNAFGKTIGGRAGSRLPDTSLNEKKASDNGRPLKGSPPPKNLSNNAFLSANGSIDEMPKIGGRASSRTPDVTLNDKKASDNGRSLIGSPPAKKLGDNVFHSLNGARHEMPTIDGTANSRSLDAFLNKKKESDNGRPLKGSPPPKNLSDSAFFPANGSRDDMPTIGGRASSRSPDAPLNEKKASDNGRSLMGDLQATDLRDKADQVANGIRDEVPINTGANNSPSSDPKLHPANAAEVAGGSHSTVKTPVIENHEDFKNNLQSPVDDPVETSPFTPVDPRVSMTDEEAVNSNGSSTPVTFTENSYDASSFTSTYSPALASTEETLKSTSKSKSIHKFLSFMSWMRSKKNAGNTTENVATQLTESFDPFEEITEISDKILPMIDKEILPENLANWFLGFRSTEDDDSVNTSTVNESQSSEVLHTSSEFNDLYHSFLEAVIHNINNVSSIVNASEPIGTPFSWWSSFKEVDEPHNNTTKKSSSTDVLATSSQSSTNLDRGLMEGAIHKVNDASPIVNDSASTWRHNRWLPKLRGYTNILKGHHIVNGSSSAMSIEASSPSTFYSGAIHKADDGSRRVENTDQSEEQTSWSSKFWDFGNKVQSNSSSIVNGTQTVDVIEVGRKDTSSIGNRTEASLTAESTLESASFWSPNYVASNTTKGDMVSSKLPEFNKNSTVNTAVKKEPGDVDDDDVEIIFRRPKAEWLSLLAGMQEAQKASTPNGNGTKQHFDMRSDGKPDDTTAKQRKFSHFDGSDFEVWSGEHN